MFYPSNIHLNDLSVVTDYNDHTQLVLDGKSQKLMVKKIVPPHTLPIHQALQAVDNPNIVHIHRCIQTDSQCIVLEEFINGQTLREFCRQTPPDEKTAVNIILQVCNGLLTLHQMNIIHRDITDTNILITHDGMVKIIDFGISRFPRQDASHDTELLGTEGYAAPEQFGFHQSNPQTDIYAVGVLFNVLLTGMLPADFPYNQNRNIFSIIQKCTQLDPKNRFSDISELITALSSIYSRHFNISSSHDGSFIDRFVDSFPGIHSPKRGVRIWAWICYCMAGIFIWGIFARQCKNFGEVLIGIFGITFMILIPFLLYSNFLNFQSYLWKNIRLSTKRILFNLLATASLIFGAYLINFILT